MLSRRARFSSRWLLRPAIVSCRDWRFLVSTHLEENRARLDSMRQKLELLVEDDAPPYPEESWTVPNISIGEEDVEVAFLREKQRRSRA